MLKPRYLNKIIDITSRVLKDHHAEAFLFGSSIRQDTFGDCDVGVRGEVNQEVIGNLKERFIESTIPYKIDVVNFNDASSDFQENVFRNKVIWIKHLS